jgi:cytochrome c-type protein NapB
MRTIWTLLVILALLAACTAEESRTPADRAAAKNAASLRATRRAYDGAPPVIPHRDFKLDCGQCHGTQGIEVPEVGYSPPSPHGETMELSDQARCRQCHLWKNAEDDFRESYFVGLRQNLRRGARLHALAPPVIPHQVFMRENCQACHDGPAAREEIRCSHPDRQRCSQCHLEQTTTTTFP